MSAIWTGLRRQRQSQPTETRATSEGGYRLTDGKTVKFLTPQSSWTGVAVTPETAQTLSSVYRAVQFWSETLAQLPFNVYEIAEGEGRQRVARTQSLNVVLSSRSNPEQTAFEFREMLGGHLALRGNAMAQIVRNRAGDVSELWPLHPDWVTMRRPDYRSPSVYEIRPPGSTEGPQYLPASQVWHLRLGGGIWGTSPLGLARQNLGLGLATEEHAGRTFGNGARPGGIMKLSSQQSAMTDDAKKRLLQSFSEGHQGLEQSSRVAMFEEGMEWQEVGFNPEDSQLLESRKYHISDVSRWFNLPEHVLGGLERATHSNIEQMALEMLIFRLMPMFVRWELSANTKLLSPEEQTRYYTKFNEAALLRGDSEARSRYYRELFGIGAMSPNEIRTKEDMEPYEGGDARFVQGAMIPTELAATGAAFTGGGAEPSTDADPTEPTAKELDSNTALDPTSALNGAQVASLVQVVLDYNAGNLSRQQALSIIVASFPLDLSQANQLLADRLPPADAPNEARAALARMGLIADPDDRTIAPHVERRALDSNARHRADLVSHAVPLMEAAAVRIVREEAERIAAAVARFFPEQRDAEAFSDWLAEFYSPTGEFRAWSEEQIAAQFAGLAGQVSVTAREDAEGFELSEDQLREVTQFLVSSAIFKQHVNARAQLEELVLEGGEDLPENLVTRSQEWAERRPAKESRLWSKSISGAVVTATLGAAGYTLMRWVTLGKSCPACEGLNGKVVGIEESFAGKGERVGDAASDQTPVRVRRDVLIPPLHGGCDCEITRG